MKYNIPCIKDAPWNDYFVCSCDACMDERIEHGKRLAKEQQSLSLEYVKANLKDYWVSFGSKEKHLAVTKLL